MNDDQRRNADDAMTLLIAIVIVFDILLFWVVLRAWLEVR